ncbi:hypothetical protein JXB37_05690, partial [candidate division WOR-3 bacterium]|nr:hypothetical protein [candidate division WOR-3 bacterium]
MRVAGRVLLLAVLLVACREPGPGVDPNYSEPMVNGILYRVEFWDGSKAHDRDVEVFDNRGLRMVPVVTLNTRELKPYHYGTT